MNKHVYFIDGAKFSSFEEFVDLFSQTVLTDWQWNGNLSAFDDILWGGFGTPEVGFVLRWENSEISRRMLGNKFDQIVEIVREHGVGGAQERSGVELELL